MSELFSLQDLHPFTALVAGANAFAGTKTSKAVDMRHQKKVMFFIFGDGTTGKSTITVEKSADAAFTTPVAMKFKYRKASGNDAYGAVAEATTAGVDTDPGADKSMAIEINRRALGEGYRYVRIKAVEAVAAAVAGGIVGVTFNPRFRGQTAQDVIS